MSSAKLGTGTAKHGTVLVVGQIGRDLVLRVNEVPQPGGSVPSTNDSSNSVARVRTRQSG